MSFYFTGLNRLEATSRRKSHYTRTITIAGQGPNVPQEGRRIPWPEVPCWPILSNPRAVRPFIKGDLASLDFGLFSVGDPLFVTAGRIALGRALQLLSLQPGDKILLPAYHCLSMVEPLKWFGLEPVFYKINDDLSINLSDVETKLDKRCKALVVAHFFGFAQDATKIRDFCDSFGIALIEDCAHSFFGTYKGTRLGSFGDFAIGSLTKFFPVYDGGCLVSSRRSIPQSPLHGHGWAAETTAWVTQLQIAQYYGRLSALAPLTALVAGARKMVSAVGRAKPGESNPAQQRSGAAVETDLRWLQIATNKASLAAIGTSEPEEIVERRRANYRRICDALTDRPGLSLIKPKLGNETVPYMVPLWFDDLRGNFPFMEDRAIPMQRFGQFLFDGIDETVCPVSAALSHHGVQLPCHQDLQRGRSRLDGRASHRLSGASPGSFLICDCLIR